MNKLALVALFLTLPIGALHAAGDAKMGQSKAMACAACHGMDGNSPANPVWPKLANQHASYLTKQLVDFKSGMRKDPIMAPMAMPLSDQDIEDISAFFSEQNRNVGQPGAAEQVASGKRIYMGGIVEKSVPACISCHGPTGSGNPAAGFPSIGSQHGTYISKAMKDFRTGSRNNDTAQIMQGTAVRMSDAEIDAVAAYINALN